MARRMLNRSEKKQIEEAVAYYQAQRSLIATFAKSLVVHLSDNEELKPYVHFLKWRVKNPDHLREKLERKALARKELGESPDITRDNLMEKVGDLAGIRILHLHTEQISELNRIILSILNENQYPLVEGPTAICWDREYEDIFTDVGISAESRDSMYTSVHYVIEANQKTKIRAELQVRTLMEEVWGEVSHRVNYPSETTSRACRDQLKVLARMTSGCTRLVDSIFRSKAEAL